MEPVAEPLLRRRSRSLHCAQWLVILHAALVCLAQPTGQPRYVTTFGFDAGNCENRDLPCKTVPYALGRADAADTILVAGGTYWVGTEHLRQLLSHSAEGSFSADFSVSDINNHRTYVVTPENSSPDEDALSRAKFFLATSDFLDGESHQGTVGAHPAATPGTSLPLIGPTLCENAWGTYGGWAGSYPCKDIDVLANIPLSGLGGNSTSASDIWGYVDLRGPNPREYALIGLNNGTAIVDVSDPEAPLVKKFIPGTVDGSRDIQVLQIPSTPTSPAAVYAYVVTQDVMAGVQIIDLSALPGGDPVEANVFKPDGPGELAHTIHIGNIDYASGEALPDQQAFAYLMGTRNPDFGSFAILDLSDPLNPKVVSTPSTGSGRSHAGATMYVSDSRTEDCVDPHNPCEVFVHFNWYFLDLWDVTDKANPTLLSSIAYENLAENHGLVHSGWPSQLNNPAFVFVQDERDEKYQDRMATMRTVNVCDLTQPFVSNTWTSRIGNVDHNGFTINDRYYMSAYRGGLRVLDIADRNGPREIGFFDSFPFVDPNPIFERGGSGAWGTYPFLPSGTIVVSDTENGLFLLREQVPEPSNSSTPPPRSPSVAGSASAELTGASSNVNLASVRICLNREMSVHITASISARVNYHAVREDGTPLLFSPFLISTGFHYNTDPNQIWGPSLRFENLSPWPRWENLASTHAVTLGPGVHTIYWKLHLNRAGVELSEGVMLVEAFSLGSCTSTRDTTRSENHCPAKNALPPTLR